jgi:peptide/nickel transport system substrate-binding protein
MWKLFAVLVVLVMALSSLAACGPTTAPEEPAEPAEATEAPVAEATAAPEEPEPTEPPPAERKVATFIWTQEPDNLNPMYTSMWFSTITQQIWNCDPWIWDENNEPQSVLLAEMPSLDNGGISEDGTTITLNLRDDIVWSDGEPITSADFVFTWEMYTNPANTVASTYPYDLLAAMEAPDERTVVMSFDEPFVPWMAAFGTEIIPEHVLRPVFDAEGSLDTAEWNEAPMVGCGPYTFAEWESGSFMRFVRNDNYYDEPANIDEIFLRFVPDDASQIAALRTGEGDLGTFFSYSDMPTLEEAGVQIIMAPSGYNEGWYFYFGEEAHPAISDVRVRQAIALCFDRFSVVEDLLLGKTEVAASFWHNTPFQDPDLEPWPYDPERGKALLDEAGWVDTNDDGVRDKDGEELILVHGTTTREVRADTQAVAQQQLAECGIQLDIVGYASDVFFLSYGEGGPAPSGELDIFEYSGNTDFPDPNTSRFLCGEVPSDEFPDGNNDQKLCDEDLEALFQLQATQVDFAERQQTFWEIGNYMTENVYWLGVWYDPDAFGVSERLTNVTISGAAPFYSIAAWDLE